MLLMVTSHTQLHFLFYSEVGQISEQSSCYSDVGGFHLSQLRGIKINFISSRFFSLSIAVYNYNGLLHALGRLVEA